MNLLFDFRTDLILEVFITYLGFLLILNKKYGSDATGLSQTDLDLKDSMNYNFGDSENSLQNYEI
jgi:hypothetical protein